MAAIIAILFFITTFLAVATAVLIAAFIQSRLRARQNAQPEIVLDDDQEPVLLSDPRHNPMSVMELVLKKLNIIQHLSRVLDDAGLRWSVGRVGAMMLLLGGYWRGVGNGRPVVAAGIFAGRLRNGREPAVYVSFEAASAPDESLRISVSGCAGEPCTRHASRPSAAERH